MKHKLFTRLTASAVPAVLAVAWFADPVHAQGGHPDHQPAPLPPQELLTSLAHGAAQGACAFLAGLAAFAVLVWLPASRTEDDEGSKALPLFRRCMWALLGLLVAAGLVEISLYAVRASGDALGFGLLAEALFDTRVGMITLSRFGLGLLVVTAAAYAARRGNAAYWRAAAAVAVLLLMTLSRQSHAAAEGGLLPFVADWLHVVAASAWMGGLLGFPILLVGPLRAMPPEARLGLLVRAVRRFSMVATVAVAALLVTGLYATILHLPSISALLSTSYGLALLAKLGLLTVLLAVGGINLIGRGRKKSFGLLVGVELVLAICVFVATGFLTILPPADAGQQNEEGEAPPAESTRPPPGMRAPAPPVEKASDTADVVVRVSGTPGIPYSGTYGGSVGATRTVDGVVGVEPSSYEVEVEDGASNGVTVAFEQKTPPGEGGILKLEIVVDGEVVAGRETAEEAGTVAASWSPRGRR